MWPLQIADGYHRVCASYHTDENTDIPVKIVPATNCRRGFGHRAGAVK